MSAAYRWLSAPTSGRFSWLWAMIAAAFVVVVASAADVEHSPLDAATWSSIHAAHDSISSDYFGFAEAGSHILHGDLGEVFSDPWIQTGPLALLWAAVSALVFDFSGVSSELAFASAAFAMLAPAFYAATLWSMRLRPPRWLYIGAAATFALLFLAWDLASEIGWQHPTYLWIPALWLLAADSAGRSHQWRVGAFLGLACGLETWAVLAIPVLLLALPGWTSRIRAAALGGAIALSVWVPFVLSGSFHMFDKTWPSRGASAIGALWGQPSEITWQMRITQAVLIVGASLIAWRVTRNSTDGATVAVAVVVWARVLTDFIFWPYYRLGLYAPTVAILLAAVAALVHRRTGRTAVALAPPGLLVSLAKSQQLPLSWTVTLPLHLALLTGLVAASRWIPAGFPGAHSVREPATSPKAVPVT
ncbi:hypothetical protein [Demequina salsinemoris]|uniref:hypothetical protein n=1 Tax=Demequina salsinemoris TaxID=577470 RepID=UPI00128D93F5|nr:hypothetical protein [Demequina salsinemoris]